MSNNSKKTLSQIALLRIIREMRATKIIPVFENDNPDYLNLNMRRFTRAYNAEDVMNAKHFSYLINMPFDNIYEVESMTNEARFDFCASINKKIGQFGFTCDSYLGKIHILDKNLSTEGNAVSYQVDTVEYVITLGRHAYLITIGTIPMEVRRHLKLSEFVVKSRAGKRNQKRGYTINEGINLGRKLTHRDTMWKIILQSDSAVKTIG